MYICIYDDACAVAMKANIGGYYGRNAVIFIAQIASPKKKTKQHRSNIDTRVEQVNGGEKE